MRIGIDATALPPDPVGAGNYIIQLIRALTALDSADEWVIFAQNHGRDLIYLSEDSRLTWHLTPDHSPAQRLIWEQTVFPALVKQTGIDLLHSLHYTRPLSLPCASVVTFHDMTFFLYPELHTRSKRLFFPWMMRFSARYADAIIADSENTRRDAIRILKIPEGKISAIPLGINPDFHPLNDTPTLKTCQEKYGLPETYILNVGLVEPRKNLPLLLEAYHRLLQYCAPPPLVIVGRLGWGVEQVFQQIERLSLQDRVVFTGYVPAQDLPVVYNLAQIFVYPSKYEGFGFPPLEAMACGVPTITSNISAMRDQVGEAALLVEPENPTALAQAMLSLINDLGLRQRLSSAGPGQATQFSWVKTALETREIYRKALAGS